MRALLSATVALAALACGEPICLDELCPLGSRCVEDRCAPREGFGQACPQDDGPASLGQLPEEQQRGILRKFNPTMAHRGPDIWAVDVSYLWHEGAPLQRGLPGENEYLNALTAIEEVLPAAALSSRPWWDLPQENTDGVRYHYFVDGPGDNLGPGRGETSWIEAFRRIQAGAGPDLQSPRQARFPPLQYANLFWLDRAQGRAGAQYWFFYPYDKWINNHEGDWEHVTLVLELAGCGPERLDPAQDRQRLVEVDFGFHGQRITLPAARTIRFGAAAGAPRGEHVLVFGGGYGAFQFWDEQSPFWEGDYSGGSYPWPALWVGAGGGGVEGLALPDDDTRRPSRLIAAEEFDLGLLPDRPLSSAALARLPPERSWLALPFYAGQPRVDANHAFIRMGGNRHPSHPHMKGGFGARSEAAPYAHLDTAPVEPLAVPAGWRPIAGSPHLVGR